jgi:hypothetical protein
LFCIAEVILPESLENGVAERSTVVEEKDLAQPPGQAHSTGDATSHVPDGILFFKFSDWILLFSFFSESLQMNIMKMKDHVVDK